MQTLQLSRESRRIGGLLLLAVVTIEFGGLYLTRVASGQVELTPFQVAFSRAGHAHAWSHSASSPSSWPTPPACAECSATSPA